MRSASFETTDRSSTGSFGESPTTRWSRSSGGSSSRSPERLLALRAAGRCAGLAVPPCAGAGSAAPAARSAALGVTVIALSIVGCDSFEWEGFLDQPIPIKIVQGIPTIPVEIDGRGPISAALDTGSHMTIVGAKYCNENVPCNQGFSCDQSTRTCVRWSCLCAEAGCDPNKLCRSGHTCDRSTWLCTPASCGVGAACPPGYRCDDAGKTCARQHCDDLLPCASGLQCDGQANSCKPASCGAAAACPPGFTCDSAAGACAAQSCSDTDTCPAGFLCDTSKHSCRSAFCDKKRPCGAGLHCDPTLQICKPGKTPLVRLSDGTRQDGELRLQRADHTTKSSFIFPDVEIFRLWMAPVGLDKPVQLGGIVGVSILGHFSARIVYGGSPFLTLSDGVPDSRYELAGDCDPARLMNPAKFTQSTCLGVFHTPRTGGGLAKINGQEITSTFEIPASRMVVPLCLMPAAFDPSKARDHGAEVATGVPVMAVVATGIGTSIISRSAFNRLRALNSAIASTPGSRIYMAHGSEVVEMTSLARLAIVSSETDELGPCGELAYRRRLLIASRAGLADSDEKLLDDKKVNGAAAAALSGAVPFAVLRDEATILQSLRLEVQPHAAGVDVILGGSVLGAFDLTADYPAQRMILQCGRQTSVTGCRIIPWCSWSENFSPACPRGK